MTLTTILNLAIGLTYVYLLLSLVASAVAEFISGYWNLRGTGLKASIRHWLDDPNGVGLAGALYDHKLIAGLIKPGMDKPSLNWIAWLIPAVSARLPSYIPKETIADALIDILDRDNAFKTGEMQPGLAALWRSAQKSAGTDAQAALKSFRDQVMKWFDDAVSRQSENYTRRSQYRLFGIGLAIAIALNADSLKIASALWTPLPPDQITKIVAAAEAVEKLGDEGLKAKLKDVNVADLRTEIDALKLPMGWGKDASYKSLAVRLKETSAANVIGWLITALAISFGAQFWFDALGRFVRLRSGGVQPKSGEKPAASKG